MGSLVLVKEKRKIWERKNPNCFHVSCRKNKTLITAVPRCVQYMTPRSAKIYPNLAGSPSGRT